MSKLNEKIKEAAVKYNWVKALAAARRYSGSEPGDGVYGTQSKFEAVRIVENFLENFDFDEVEAKLAKLEKEAEHCPIRRAAMLMLAAIAI